MNIRKIFFFILILIPPFYTLCLIHCYGMNVPFWDQWGLIPLVKKVLIGESVLSDIWGLSNEHRVFFPKIIMLALASLTKWNIMYELYTNIVLAGLALLFLFLLLRQGADRSIAPWLILVLSILIFSPAQWENWTWGWQISIFLTTLASVVVVWSVCQWPGQWKGIIVAIGSAVIASYSFNNGLLTWVIVIILLAKQKAWQRKHMILWMGAFVITTVLYYYGYSKPPQHPPLSFFMNHPYKFISYVLAYLGSPLGFSNKNISIIVGLFSSMTLCVGPIYIRRSNKEEFDRLLSWLGLALYAFLSAIVTGVGRIGYGADQALASRYITISTLFITSAFVISVFWVDHYLKTNKTLPTKWVVAISSISTVLILLYILSFLKGVEQLKYRSQCVERAGVCLENVDLATDECLKVLFIPAVVREGTKNILEMGLSFSNERIHWDKIQKIDGGLFYIDSINNLICSQLEKPILVNISKNPIVTVTGWAVDERAKDLAHSVYITLDGAPIARAQYGFDRYDVSGHFKINKYRYSGWTASINGSGFMAGEYRLSLRIVSKNKKRYYEPEHGAILIKVMKDN